MKPLATASAALALAFVAAAPASASAQRGGAARGGVSARSAPSFHSTFAPSARSFSGPAYRYSGPSFAPAPRPTPASRFAAARPSFYSLRRPPVSYRRHYPERVGVAVPYAYPLAYPDYGWIDPGYPDYTDVVSYDDASAQPVYPDPGLQQQAEPTPPQHASTLRYAPPPQPALPEEEAVTLIFKDGRPSEQIHNYALTRTMLYVRDQHRRDIPVDQLDLAATQKANQANGIEFALPAAN